MTNNKQLRFQLELASRRREEAYGRLLRAQNEVRNSEKQYEDCARAAMTDQKERCWSCNGERVCWIMGEFPVPCPECNENSPEFKWREAQKELPTLPDCAQAACEKPDDK